MLTRLLITTLGFMSLWFFMVSTVALATSEGDAGPTLSPAALSLACLLALAYLL